MTPAVSALPELATDAPDVPDLVDELVAVSKY